MLQEILELSGIDRRPVSHTERFVSFLGAFAGIAVVLAAAHLLNQNDPLVVASMGASAVLLFAVPHGNLSQPWPLFGGQVISALIGVSCAKVIHNPVLGPALAVGLAVGAMHYLRCIHPPGGATALVASLSSPHVHALGYGFVLDPVFYNTAAIFFTALAFNWLFPWRRYPAALARRPAGPAAGYEAIPHEDFVYALSQIDSFIDVSEQDLARIYEIATKRHASHTPCTIFLGHYYSNGEFGPEWSVRQIVDEGADSVIYKTVAGAGRGASGVMKREAFAAWAKHEVVRDEGNWRRVNLSPAAPDAKR